jgi:hypothetical protein
MAGNLGMAEGSCPPLRCKPAVLCAGFDADAAETLPPITRHVAASATPVTVNLRIDRAFGIPFPLFPGHPQAGTSLTAQLAAAAIAVALGSVIYYLEDVKEGQLYAATEGCPWIGTRL